MKTAQFSVSYARINQEEGEAGETDRQGMEDDGLTLSQAITCMNQLTGGMSELRGSEGNCSHAEDCSWFTAYWTEFDSGDDVTGSIHYPNGTTAASRGRLTRLLARTF